MPDLINILESFNRKERYFLLCEILGLERFALSEEFLERLQKTIGVEVPKGAFVAMDYHLDWLVASLKLYKSGKPDGSTFCNPEEQIDDETARLIRGTQEDVDILVAFPCGSDKQYHIVMIEAKGYTGWDTKQLQSKARRLKQIFGSNGKKYENVEPHFFVAGPKESQGLEDKAKGLPGWMARENKLEWLTIHLPVERRVVERWNPDKKKPDKSGSHFRVR